jgi:hypothetical protein
MRTALLLAASVVLCGCVTEIVIGPDGKVIGECDESFIASERWSRCLHRLCPSGLIVEVNPMNVPDDVRCMPVDSGCAK